MWNEVEVSAVMLITGGTLTSMLMVMCCVSRNNCTQVQTCIDRVDISGFTREYRQRLVSPVFSIPV